MNLKLKKKPMKSLSNNDNQLPIGAIKQVAGGSLSWPSGPRICRGDPD
ncbi:MULTISPECIES: hypothetical protein [Pseudoalteromonas]|nr:MULTISPECIES: hypothetical protein [Pseudoalteromonas]